MSDTERWPSLPYAAWKDTYATLHMWTQIVGKIRLARTPWINHSWHVPLYVTARGLTTSPVFHGARAFQIDFDFVAQRVLVQTDDGAVETVALRPRTVADLYAELFTKLRRIGIDVRINTTPNEVVDAIPFERDDRHAAYDGAQAERCWRALVQAHRVLTAFRARFIGKCSPVHFFWGSFDLAVTRFSGRNAPPHPGGVPHLPDRVAREAYSHEVSSCGFWPGNDAVPQAAFYAYAYPEPAGFSTARVRPAGARYDGTLHEFILAYDDVRAAADPDAALLDFCQSTYEAAADLARWDRAALERDQVPKRGEEIR
jgi:hypothetical protein